MLTLIEKAEQVYEKEEAEEAASRLLEGTFTLDDFLDQMQQLKKMGPLSGHRRDDPRHAQGAQGRPDRATTQIARVEAIIRSMTPGERAERRLDRRLPPGPHRQGLRLAIPARSPSW